MSSNPNKLSQFWQELKRRNVIRVITVYAGAAFVIIELINNITEPLLLPDWTPTLVIVLLAIGFPIVIIFSWIYDIHPEGGIIKTDPGGKVKADEIPKSSNSWKIASYISFVVILGLIFLQIITRTNKKEILEKSIAVLPFINDSPERENEYFLNGIMEELLIKLQAIEDLRVVSRSSVEQFRDQRRPSISEIAERLDVNYIVEGSGQRYGNTFTLRIQLIKGYDDDHLWAKSYEEQLESVEVVTRIHSEIAESIAAELKAIITPAEKQIIDKIPTQSLSAYDFYQRGREEYLRNWVDNRDRIALERAEKLFLRALEIDSTFAQAYVGLARLYWAEQGFRTYLEEDHLDSMLLLCDLALSYDDQLAEAYTIRGFYFRENGEKEKAVKEFDKALLYNPNDWETYRWKGRLYAHHNLVEYINNNNKAVSLNHSSELPFLLRLLAQAYSFAGFTEKSQFYNNEAFKLDGDSVAYYSDLSHAKENQGDFIRQAEFLIRAYEMDTSRSSILIHIGVRYMYAGQYEEMLEYYKKLYARVEASGALNLENMHRIGFAYWMNGYSEEADYYFDTMTEYYENLIMQERMTAGTYYDLAGVYAFRGEKEKAIEYLRIFNREEIFPHWWVVMLKNDPLFDSIRDDAEFRQIFREVEAKYQAEHDRVKQWLEDNNLL